MREKKSPTEMAIERVYGRECVCVRVIGIDKLSKQSVSSTRSLFNEPQQKQMAKKEAKNKCDTERKSGAKQK